jgi:hypothetical protein
MSNVVLVCSSLTPSPATLPLQYYEKDSQPSSTTFTFLLANHNGANSCNKNYCVDVCSWTLYLEDSVATSVVVGSADPANNGQQVCVCMQVHVCRSQTCVLLIPECFAHTCVCCSCVSGVACRCVLLMCFMCIFPPLQIIQAGQNSGPSSVTFTYGPTGESAFSYFVTLPTAGKSLSSLCAANALPGQVGANEDRHMLHVQHAHVVNCVLSSEATRYRYPLNAYT